MTIRAAVLIMIAALSASALPAPAHAASRVGPAPFTYEGDTITLVVYVPDPAETPNVALTQTATDLVITAPNAQGLTAAAPCVVDSATVARCPVASLVPKAFGVLADGPTGGPLTLATAPGVTLPILGWGNPAHADRLTGGAGYDFLAPGRGGTADGGDGDDRLISRDPHGATLLGGAGDDELVGAADAAGGPGDDEIDDALTADGGPGDDELYDVQTGFGGDGRDSMLGKAITAPVRLDGGPGVDNLQAEGRDAVVHGGDGGDYLTECQDCDAAGTVLAGDGGDDQLNGSSRGATLDGGDGADRITVGIAPAFRADTVLAGAGNDLIWAANDVAERLDCGDGADRVFRDAHDAVIGCETRFTQAEPALSLAGTRWRQRVGADRRVRLTLRCPATLLCRAAISLRLPHGVYLRRVVRFRGTRTVEWQLGPTTFARLRRHGTLKARLRVWTFDDYGADAVPAPAPRTITLLAPTRR